MRILIVTDGIPENSSLVGLFEFDQARSLSNFGHEVVLLAIDTYSISYKRKMGYYSLTNQNISIEVYNYPIGRRPEVLSANIAAVFARHAFQKTLEKYKPFDVIHAHFYYSAYLVAKNKGLFKCPFVITEHSSRVNTENPRLSVARLAHYAYQSADTIIGVGEALCARLKEQYHVIPTYVPNVVQTVFFKKKNTYPQNKYMEEKFKFVSVGNLIKLKKMDFLVDCFIKAFSIEDSVELVIFGDGHEKKHIQDKIFTGGYSSRITIKGRVTREVIADEYKEANCFVLASETETFGVAYVEALAAGLPVIATRCGGPEGFVNEENGILIDVNDERQLIKALQMMKRREIIYDSEYISKEARKRYSSEAVAEQLTSIYISLEAGK